MALAQETHEAMLYAFGGMKPEVSLRYDRPTPVGSTWEAAYVDDHGIIQKLNKQRAACFPIVKAMVGNFPTLNLYAPAKKLTNILVLLGTLTNNFGTNKTLNFWARKSRGSGARSERLSIRGGRFVGWCAVFCSYLLRPRTSYSLLLEVSFFPSCIVVP